MARGAEAKEYIGQKIIETFAGAFPYDKEIRIPYLEDGNRVEIKITMTCAKTNVGEGAPGDGAGPVATPAPAAVENKITEPTQEEKDNIAFLMNKLGL